MKRDVFIGIVFLVIGAAISWGITHHYANIAQSEAVEVAIETAERDGREEGMAQGLVEAQRAWDSASIQMIEERFPSIVNAIRADSFKAGDGEGYSRGLREGEEKGFRLGLQEGVARGNSSADRIAIAEKNWQIYWKNLQRIRGIVEDGAGQEALVGEVSALVSAATELKNSYVEQATAFNSLVQELEMALQARNFPEIRRLVVALEGSAELKGSIFIDSIKTQEQTFSELGERLPR